MRTGATTEFQATEEPQDLEQTPQARQADPEIRAALARDTGIREIQTLEKTDLPSLEAVLRIRRRRAVRPETEAALERLLEAARANRLQGKIPKRAFPVRKQTARSASPALRHPRRADPENREKTRSRRLPIRPIPIRRQQDLETPVLPALLLNIPGNGWMAAESGEIL